MSHRTAVTAVVLCIISLVRLAAAEVVRVEIDSREPVLDGQPFGDVGPYELITGTIHFAFDPANPYNARIVDLDKAPRNDKGRVEAHANFVVLQPTELPYDRRCALVEVSNRGGKASLAYFNLASRGGALPSRPAHFGDGLLMRHGLTIIWIGWQWDVPERPGQLRLHVPIATNNGEPITGLVRSDWTVDRTVHTLDVAHRNHIAYPVLDPNDPANVLTVRDGRDAERRIVPREQWRFARETDDGVIDDPTHIYSASGFEAGGIYELVYRAKDPRVVGLGLAAIRDVMAYAKHDADSPFAAPCGIAFGVSQTGRFLRHFLYQGFNTDERGRKVYDGMLIHTAGAGRGSFNHRFAQPSRDAHRYSAFFYPTDIFPFTSRVQFDRRTGAEDGLFAQMFEDHHAPNVFYTNTGYEYWGRAASLIHTTTDGGQDVQPTDAERIYHLAGAQHFPVGFPPRQRQRMGEMEAYRGNPVQLLLPLRALLVDLVQWVRDDVPPPPSMHPTIRDGTLTTIDHLDFPAISGVSAPSVAHTAYRADYGPRFDRGIIDHQPPKLGEPFVTLVPQVDEFGNEEGGVPNIEVMAPLATYAPWNLRVGLPNPHELYDFYGTFIPLPLTDAQREATGDARPSVESLYRSREEYLHLAERAAEQLVARRLLLREDGPRALQRAEAIWDWMHRQADDER